MKPTRSACALSRSKPSSSIPAMRARCARIRRTASGCSAASPMRPALLMRRNSGPAFLRATACHASKARAGRDCLFGEIEIDEAYVGGPEAGKRGRQTEKKSIVVVAAEKNGRGIGRIRLRRVKDVSAESLLDFIRETVEPGATIHTDGWKGYAGLPIAGYKHRVAFVSGGDEQAHEVMPRVHNVAALLKRWLLGTLQGGVQQQHLDYYLDEFTFRFNRRRSNARGLLFHRLAQQ